MDRNSDQTAEIRLSDLVRLFARRRWLIAISAFGAGGVALALALIVPKKYTASVLVDPAAADSVGGGFGGLKAVASEFGGLASLVGLHAPVDTSGRADRLAVLESRQIAEKFIRENNLLPILYRGQWDAKAQHWRASMFHPVPTVWKAASLFNEHIRTVKTDAKTGLVRVSVTWSNPQVAAEWANGLVKLTNEYLRGEAIKHADKDIGYLTGEAQKTTLVGEKKVIYSLMESQIERSMLARGSTQFALKVLDPAQPPEKPSSPRPVLWTVLGVILGAVVSFFGVLLNSSSTEPMGRNPGDLRAAALGNSRSDSDPSWDERSVSADRK